MPTLTVYPDAHPESTTVDGLCAVDNLDLSWPDIVAHGGNYANDSFTFAAAFSIIASSTANQWTRLYRTIFLFDTYSLGSGATISAVIMSLYGGSKVDDLGISPNIDIYTSAPALNTALVAGDFDSLGSVSQTGSPITYDSFSTAGYNNFTFNATGIGNINKTGVSKFGARNANYDVSGVAPTWSSSAESGVWIYFADQTGTTNDPKLVVTYTEGEAETVPGESLLINVNRRRRRMGIRGL